MSRTQHFSALLLLLLAPLPTFNAWQFSQTNVDLSSPPPINSGDSIVNGKPLFNYSSRTTWPCYSWPVPQDVARTPFPIREGQLTFTLTNDSASSLFGYHYIGDAYVGQISLGNGTYTNAEGIISVGFSHIDTYAWYDFSNGLDCSDPINMVGNVARALSKDTGALSASDLVGMNATIGVRIVLFGPNSLSAEFDYQPVEEMDQCGYIYFTDEDLSNDPNAGYCNGGPLPTGGSVAAPTTLVTSSIFAPTSPSSPVPTPENSIAAATSGSHTNAAAIGTGVGVSVGASLLILIIAFMFVYRRRARKHSESIGADTMVTRPRDADEANGTEDEKGLDSSGSSTFSEQLPPYPSAKEVPKEDSESDVTWNVDVV